MSFELLSKMRSLPQDWFASEASPPNETAIGLASRVLECLDAKDFAPSRIDPSTEEGVCISFRSGSKYADIECFNSGYILGVLSGGDIETIVWEIGCSEIVAAVNRIQEFIADPHPNHDEAEVCQ